MSDDKMINIHLNETKSIEFIVITTAERNRMFCSEFVTLQKGKMYYIPIDSKLELKDHTFFKINSDLIDSIDVRNISNGTATIIPLIHGVQLKSGTNLGKLI